MDVLEHEQDRRVLVREAAEQLEQQLEELGGRSAGAGRRAREHGGEPPSVGCSASQLASQSGGKPRSAATTGP